MYNFQYLTLIEQKHRDNALPSINLKAHTNTDSKIMNQLVFIIVPLGIKRFHAHSGSVNSLACFQHLVSSLEGHEHATLSHRIEPTEGGVLLEFA